MRAGAAADCEVPRLPADPIRTARIARNSSFFICNPFEREIGGKLCSPHESDRNAGHPLSGRFELSLDLYKCLFNSGEVLAIQCPCASLHIDAALHRVESLARDKSSDAER